MKSPALARALLLAAAGTEQSEFVAGDLEEEFALICEQRGRSAGRRWYGWQVLRSVAPLVQVRIRSGEITVVTLRAFFGVTLPLVLLDRLWSFVYSQIPLKEGLQRAPEYLAVNLALTCLCAALSGGSGLAAAAAAAVAMWVSAADVPAAYVAAVLVGTPVSSMAAVWWRRGEEQR